MQVENNVVHAISCIENIDFPIDQIEKTHSQVFVSRHSYLMIVLHI